MSIIDIIWLYKLFDYGIIINDKKVHLTNMHTFKESVKLSQASSYSSSRRTMQINWVVKLWAGSLTHSHLNLSLITFRKWKNLVSAIYPLNFRSFMDVYKHAWIIMYNQDGNMQ